VAYKASKIIVASWECWSSESAPPKDFEDLEGTWKSMIVRGNYYVVHIKEFGNTCPI
jgi:hypothetical protein